MILIYLVQLALIVNFYHLQFRCLRNGRAAIMSCHSILFDFMFHLFMFYMSNISGVL
jgi:hypothetical protein